MTESTSNSAFTRSIQVRGSRGPKNSPAATEKRDSHFMEMGCGVSYASTPSGASNAYWSEAGSTLQLQTIIGELLTAVRSLLRDDRESAEVSVDRVSELMDYRSRSGMSAPTVGCPTPEGIPSKIRGGLAPWQLRRVTAHIENHLDGRVTTLDLATVAKVSTYHFTRAFRQSLSETPHEYVMRRRVERAQGLMLTTNTALGRIAIDCGFADQAHFNKLFRRFAGESPGAWRRARLVPPLGTDIHALPN